MSLPGRGESYKWWVVGMLWCVCFFNYADRQAIFSVFPLLQSQLHLSDVQLGVVGASFMWMYALVGPFAGWIGDRVSRKRLVLGGLIFWSLTTSATALSHSYAELVLCRSLGGLAEAFYFPASMSLIGDYHSQATRSRAMAIHQSSVYAGTTAGGTLAGFAAQNYGWRSGFVCLGGLGILLGILLLIFLREPKRGQSESAAELAADSKTAANARSWRDDLRAVFRNRIVFVLMAVFIGANFVAMVFLSWMPSFLYRKFHLSLSMAGWNGTAYLQIASVLGVLSGGILADRLARRRKGGRMLVQLLGLSGGIPFLFLAGWTLSIPLVVAAMAGFGYCKGLYDANIFASLYDSVDVRQRSAAAGILNSLGWLGGGIAPLAVAAASRRFSMSACISATSMVYLVVACLLGAGILAVRRPIRSCPSD